MNTLVWLMPTLSALFLYGIGQGLVKKFIVDVPPARFCLYLVAAKAIVNLGFFFTHSHPPLFAPEGIRFSLIGLCAYLMDGTGWILYFESIVAGPITIVGTLSAAYPALTVLFARLFLNESLFWSQYLGVFLVIAGCIGLSCAPADASGKRIEHYWIPFAATALVLWGASQTLVKYSYSLPNASEGSLAFFNTIGGAITLGIYGMLRGGSQAHSPREWGISFLPMGMMAGGDLAVLIASRTGPVSVVTPVSGAYPIVTLIFAWIVLKERLHFFQWFFLALVLGGMFLAI